MSGVRNEAGSAEPGTRGRPLTISELNQGVDALLRESLGVVWVTGEVSRFVAHRSGHWYFTLKDASANVSCAMFRGRNRQVRFAVEDGVEVLAMATVGVYPPQGRYQLVVEALEARGEGAYARALEKRRRRLAAEGLFDPRSKQSLAAVPASIGVVTSIDGAAIRDVLRVVGRRFPAARVVVAPASVQGAEAPAEIVRAIASLDRRGLDVLLVVRGGGAREDLAAFDEESVVRAIAAASTPIVTGIGHEIDTTLADLAADRRAPTPSAAAELAVPDRRELFARLSALRGSLVRGVRWVVTGLRSRARAALAARGLARVPQRLQRARRDLVECERRLERCVSGTLTRLARRVAGARHRLSPEGLRRALMLRQNRLHRAWERSAAAARTRVAARRDVLARGRERLVPAMSGRLLATRNRLSLAATRLDGLSPLGVLSRGYALAQRDGPKGAVIRGAQELRIGDRIHLRLGRGAADAVVEELHDDPQVGEVDGQA